MTYSKRSFSSFSLVHLLAAAMLAAAGCGGSQCPDGFVVGTGGGCIALSDAGPSPDGAVDAGPGWDGALPGPDGSAPDASLSADGCALVAYYVDSDGDGHGDPSSATTSCAPLAGHVTSSDDCDDTCSACFDDATEVCDGEDNDCDGEADEGVTTAYYVDADGDGRGSTSATLRSCTMPAGYVPSSDDCDDTSSSRSPVLPEACDAIDNDCDTTPDDGFACVRGAPTACTTTCGTTGAGTCTTSCELPSVCTPPAETCNDVDEDCDGIIDEGRRAMGPRRDLGAGTSRVVAFQTSTGYLVLYDTAVGIRARRLDDGGALTGSEIAITSTSAAFSAVVSGSSLVVSWLASDNLYATVLDASTLVATTATTAVVLGIGSFTTRLNVLAYGTGVTFVFFNGTGIHALSRSLPSFGGSSSAFPIDASAHADFDLARIGARGYVAYTSSDDDIEIRSFAIGGAYDATVSATVTSGGDPERAPALFVGDVGGGVIRLGVAYDRRSSGTLARIRLAIYDVASAGGLTARDSLDVLGTTLGGGFTTPTAAVEGTPIDVTWAGGRWIVSALRAGSGTTSTWHSAEVVERAGRAPVATSGAIEPSAADNRSTAIAPGVTGRALFVGSRTDGVTRAYLFGCGS